LSAPSATTVEVRLGASGPVRVVRGRRALGVILEAGRPIGRACRGAGVCLACGIWLEGPASPVGPAEAALIARRSGPIARGGARWRIACLVRIEGDVRIDTDYW